jgi:cellulose synthase/poly-beta-1,6-N-acetylglucosamine synthase-like glycosyltransferase
MLSDTDEKFSKMGISILSSLLRVKRFPLVSIVITGKNEKNTIERCIVSVFSQSYPNFESIYVDSNSRDGTFEIALKLQDASDKYRNCKRYMTPSL